jgi:predicted ArsR family transcriptional regulator
MDLSTFDQTLGNLTASLGDPTRRGIYIAVREAAEPLTAGEIADVFDIHPNVARHHLDILTEDGYLEVTSRRIHSGAGRPAKGFRATDKPIELRLSPRRTDLLLDLLLEVVDELGGTEVSAVARRVGKTYGAQIAAELGPGEQGFEDALVAVAKAMGTMGFDTAADPDAGVYLTSHCPFGQTALAHPEIVCALDQGIVDGLLAALDPDYHSKVIPHPGGSATCETHVETGVPLTISSRS